MEGCSFHLQHEQQTEASCSKFGAVTMAMDAVIKLFLSELVQQRIPWFRRWRPSSKLEMWERGAKNRSGHRSRRCWLAKPLRSFPNGIHCSLCFMDAAFCTPNEAWDQPEMTTNTPDVNLYKITDPIWRLWNWLKGKLSHNCINL